MCVQSCVKQAQLGSCRLCPPRGPESPRNSSSSKVGPKVGFWGSLEVVKSRSKLHTFDLLWTTFKDPPKPTFRPTFELLEFLGLSGPLGGQRQHRASCWVVRPEVQKKTVSALQIIEMVSSFQLLLLAVARMCLSKSLRCCDVATLLSGVLPLHCSRPCANCQYHFGESP